MLNFFLIQFEYYDKQIFYYITHSPLPFMQQVPKGTNYMCLIYSTHSKCTYSLQN